MIFRRKTTRIELERTTLQVRLAPAGILCPRCGAPVNPCASCPVPQTVDQSAVPASAQILSLSNKESSK